eukprot:5269184-Pyramimonas_sp.AAC.1
MPGICPLWVWHPRVSQRERGRVDVYLSCASVVEDRDETGPARNLFSGSSSLGASHTCSLLSAMGTTRLMLTQCTHAVSRANTRRGERLTKR